MIKDPSTDSEVWSPGIHYALPWVKVSHLVTKAYTVFDTPVKGCKTKDNVTVRIDIDCVFRIMGDAENGEDPSLVTKFVHQVTPRYFDFRIFISFIYIHLKTINLCFINLFIFQYLCMIYGLWFMVNDI